MNKMFSIVKNNILIFISILLMAFGVIIELIPNLMINTSLKLFIYIISIILVFIDMKLKNRKENDLKQKERNRKRCLIIILIIYILLVTSLLLFDGTYRRNFGFNSIKLFSKEHFEIYSNLIPFGTISSYFVRLSEGSINKSIVVTNILGNLIAFAPLGILLPLISKEKFSKLLNFIITMIVIVFIIEIIQFMTLVGSFDVDDLILNVVGSVITYGIIKIKPIKILFEKILE